VSSLRSGAALASVAPGGWASASGTASFAAASATLAGPPAAAAASTTVTVAPGTTTSAAAAVVAVPASTIATTAATTGAAAAAAARAAMGAGTGAAPASAVAVVVVSASAPCVGRFATPSGGRSGTGCWRVIGDLAFILGLFVLIVLAILVLVDGLFFLVVLVILRWDRRGAHVTVIVAAFDNVEGTIIARPCSVASVVGVTRVAYPAFSAWRHGVDGRERRLRGGAGLGVAGTRKPASGGGAERARPGTRIGWSKLTTDGGKT
jgi:hypothetical protein